MAPPRGTSFPSGVQSVELTLATASSILQIVKLLKRQESSRALRIFYCRLSIYCIFVLDHVKRIRPALSPCPDLINLIDQILHLFESLVATTPNATGRDGGESYPRQGSLNRHWAHLQIHSEDARLEFANQSLVVTNNALITQKLDEDFSVWQEDFLARFPESVESWSAEETPPPRNTRSEPSYAVWSAAQSLFMALNRSHNCKCDPKCDLDELDARLCLGTHRKPESADDDDSVDDEFDLFLSLQKSPQEVHVQTVRDTVVKFSMPGDTQRTAKTTPKYKPMPVKTLCEQIKKMSKTSQRMELKVERGRLLKLRSEQSSFQIHRSKPPISLQHLITKGSRHLTEKTKRILAVLLGYAVLHLHGTPWLQPNWDSSQILFFHTSSSKIPLRPFIRTDLRIVDQQEPGRVGPEEVDIDDIDPDDLDLGDLDPDDLDPDDIEHPFPSLVTLAVILIELYLTAPFDVLASKRNISLPDGTQSRTRSLDVSLVFKEYKNEIPQNSKFYYAIEKCLDPRTWEDDYGKKLNDDMLRVKVYQEVIRPLEDELCDGFDFITIEKLDKIAEGMDVATWGQIIQDDLPMDVSQTRDVPSPPTVGTFLHPYQHMLPSPPSLQHSMFPGWVWNLPGAQDGFTPGLSRSVTPEPDYGAARFYDDEDPSGAQSPVKLQKYLAWKAKYKAVYRKFIEPFMEEPPQCPVKIAVLDTGVDETHDLLDTGQIKSKRNWTSKKHRKAIHDSDGHGTFTASLIIDYAPDAKLYIAKVAEREPPSPAIVAEAIRYAVDEWGVDMISMSFGYPSRQIAGYSSLDDAILHAHSRNVLMFAAASNSGGNLDRSHPARDEHVICVHSTDADGNRSSFSPTALARTHNLATVGESVQSAWPVHLCDVDSNPECLRVASGTSYATPIMVGIAAFLLQYVRIHLKDNSSGGSSSAVAEAAALRRQSKMRDVLVKIAEKTQQSASRDGYSYVALSLFADILFGKDKEFIDATLGEILRG